MKTLFVATAALLALAPPAMAKDAPASARFRTEVRIDIGADGRVSSVGLDGRLPAALHAPVREHVSSWEFQGPQRNGVAVSGTTYAYLSGCAVETPAGIAVSFDKATNGPGHGDRGIVGTSRFPMRVLPRGRYVVTADYVVEPTGHVTVEKVSTDGRRDGGIRGLEKAVAQWLRERRFLPEQLDGQPVATRMSLPITYTFDMAPDPVDPPGTAACAVAAGASKENEAVAVDSPFRREPAG